MQICPKCSFDNLNRALFCTRCETKLEPSRSSFNSFSAGDSTGISPLSRILSSNDRQTVKTRGFIEITSHTVRLENDVYQLRNVTGFGVSDVKTKGIPFSFIFALLIFALLSFSFIPKSTSVSDPISGLATVSLVLWMLLIGAVAINVSLPKLYGLSLYLNSGNEIIFITKDMEFLKRVVRILKEFMENPPDGEILSITIGGNVGGNVTLGNVNTKITTEI
jgi:Family of unknown function (DUF6232)